MTGRPADPSSARRSGGTRTSARTGFATTTLRWLAGLTILAASVGTGASDSASFEKALETLERAPADRPIVEQFEVQRSLARQHILAGLDSAARDTS